MKRSLLRNDLLLTLCSVVIFFICLEVILAFFAPQTIIVHPYHEQYHPVMGWVNKPNVAGRVYITHDISFFRTHNNKGIRAVRDYSYDKPAGVKRVLLLGDSFFWGFGVDDTDIISEVLQRKVGNSIEIINGAVTGYGTDQELLWVIKEGLQYKPDLVILGFFPTNDLDEISHSVMYGYPKPYFMIKGDDLMGKNIPVPDTRETRRKAFENPQTRFGKLKKFLRHNVHSYQFFVGRLNRIVPLRRFFLEIGLAQEYTTTLPGIPRYTSAPDKVQALSNALIKEIKKRAEETGADFLLVFIPKREGRTDRTQDRDDDTLAWNRRVSLYLQGFTAYNNINYIDLLPIFREYRSGDDPLYVPGNVDHHWTPHGHSLAANAIYEWMKQNGF